MQPKSARLTKLESKVNVSTVSAVVRGNGRCQCAAAHVRSAEAPALSQKDRLDLSHCEGLPTAVANSVRETSRRGEAVTVRVTEKQDRATSEQALDPRTRLVRLLLARILDATHDAMS